MKPAAKTKACLKSPPNYGTKHNENTTRNTEAQTTPRISNLTSRATTEKPSKNPSSDPTPKKEDTTTDPSQEPPSEDDDKKKRDIERKIIVSLLSEPILDKEEADEDDYLLDSGAKFHCTIKSNGMINIENSTGQVTVGDSRQVKVTMVGDLPLITDDDEIITLCETRVIEGFHHNIISLPILLKKGCNIKRASHRQIEIKCPNNTFLTFTRRADNLYYLRAFWSKTLETGNISDVSGAFLQEPKVVIAQHQVTIDINKAHVLLDHTGETRLREFAKHANWKLTGTIHECQACLYGKARQANTSKETTKIATEPGERLYWDLTGPFHESLSKKKYLALMVDQKTHRIWHQYLHAKSASTKAFKIMLNEVENLGVTVKYIRLDGGGENYGIMTECKRRKITVERTSPYTPQFNGVVERVFPTIKGKAVAILSAAALSEDQRRKLWAHATDDVILTENLLPKQGYANSYEPFGEEPPVKPSNLLPFGLRGEMTIPKKQPNFANKSETVVRVGYAKSSSHDTYLVMKITNNEPVRSRNVKWYKKWWWQTEDNQLSTIPTNNPNDIAAETPPNPNTHLIPPDNEDTEILASVNRWKDLTIEPPNPNAHTIPDTPDAHDNTDLHNEENPPLNEDRPMPIPAADPAHLPALHSRNDQLGRESKNQAETQAKDRTTSQNNQRQTEQARPTLKNKKLQSEMN
ncbi:hypothetical protein ACA910_014387 [Epithemia clementina (nom. ined.)]